MCVLLLPVFMVFSFTSGIDAIIALEEDGYVSDFMGFYMREVCPWAEDQHVFFGFKWVPTGFKP